MTPSQKFAYRGSLLTLLAVFLVVVVVGFLGDWIGRNRSRTFEKAEGFIADLHALATEVPRMPDGSIVRQGMLSTAWLDDVGALPARLQAMAGTLRGGEDQRSLGLVRTAPWSATFPVESKDSLVWTSMFGVPEAVCEQFIRATLKHSDQVAYISSFGDPPIIPAALNPARPCSVNFSNFALITLDPPTEVRRLAADIENAVKTMPANLTDKMPISGSSAPFQVNKGQDGGPGFIQRDQSRTRVTINNLPIAVCVLAYVTGPRIFGMDAFEAPDGKTVSPRTRPASEALCNDMKGRLIMSRS
jgi:hypothetical protein